VILKGTQIYNAEKGGFQDVGMLDIQQIFGRAGRPQFDTSGEAILICEHEKLNKYLSLLTHALPIESQFIKELPNHLNAEIILGTVSTLNEAVQWLSYTYLYTRMSEDTHSRKAWHRTTGYNREVVLLNLSCVICVVVQAAQPHGIRNQGEYSSLLQAVHSEICQCVPLLPCTAAHFS